MANAVENLRRVIESTDRAKGIDNAGIPDLRQLDAKGFAIALRTDHALWFDALSGVAYDEALVTALAA